MTRNFPVFSRPFAAVVAICFITHFGFGQSREGLLEPSPPIDLPDAETLELPTLPEGSMRLETAFVIALQNNPGIEEVEARIAGAQATIERARSYLFPVVAVNAAYAQGHATMQPDWMPQIRVEEDFNQFTAGAGFRWRLFDGLQDIHYLRAAKENLVNKEQMYLEARRILLEQVSGAFIQAEMAMEQMRIARSNFEFNQKLRRDARVRWQVGELPESDVLNFGLALKQAKAKYLGSQRDYRAACTVIAQLLSFEDAVLPENSLPKASFEGLEEGIPDFHKVRELALTYRPDLKAIEAGVRAYEHQAEALQGTLMPSIDLVAGINYKRLNDVGVIDQDEHDSQVGLQSSWTLFNGGRRKAQVLEMRAERNALYQKQRQLIDAIESGLQQIILDMETSKEVYQLQLASEQDAARIRAYVEKAYQTGSASITRLNEAQNGWVQASAAASAARLQMLLHWYRLKAATGEILSCAQND